MLYTVVILVCSTSLQISSCTRDTAYNVIVTPERQTLAHCGAHGQRYLAGTAISLDESYVKVLCEPGTRALPVRQAAAGRHRQPR